jgi:hypothetical protein
MMAASLKDAEPLVNFLLGKDADVNAKSMPTSSVQLKRATLKSGRQQRPDGSPFYRFEVQPRHRQAPY